jgi:type VI secretion system VasI family protein
MPRWLFAGSAFVLSAIAPAAAQDRRADLEAAITACTAVTSMIERLRCFDRLGREVRAQKSGAATPADPATDLGKWKQTTKYGGDGKPVLLRLELAAEDDGGGASQDRTVLLVSCSEQGTGVWLEGIATAGADTLVALQLDAAKPIRQRWANAADGRNMGLWTNGDKTAQRLAEADRLKITYPADGGRRTSTIWFDLHGMAQAAKPLRDYCHW